MTIQSTSEGNQKYIKETYLIGLGKVGLKFLRMAERSGVKANLVNIVVNRGALNNFEERGITRIVLESEDVKNPVLVVTKLTASFKMARFIIVAGLGGRTGETLLKALTSHFSNEGIEHFSIGVCPFIFEGTKRRYRAIEAIRQLENHLHFKYFDNNLVVEQHNGKINLGKAFSMVDDIILRFILNLLSQQSSASLCWN